MNNKYSNYPLDITDHVMQSDNQISKSMIADHAHSLLELIEEGHIDALSVAMQIKYLQEVMDLANEKLREYVLDELNKFAKGEDIIKHGATFQLKEAAISYDYSNCGDTRHAEIINEIATLTKERKDREKFLRTIKDSMTVVDESTGEIKTLHQPVKKSTSTYQIIFNK